MGIFTGTGATLTAFIQKVMGLSGSVANSAITADDISAGKILNFPKNFLNAVYPIGSIYLTMNSANPATLFGGTWTAIGKGCTLVGVDTGQAEFNTVGKTGGEKIHALTVAEMPSHNHTQDAHSHTFPANTYFVGNTNTPGYFANYQPTGTSNGMVTDTHNVPMNSISPNIQNAGGNTPHNNLQPYLTVYIWQKTA